MQTQFILSLPRQHKSLHVWLTSLSGCLHTTWASVFIRLSCSPVHVLSITIENSVVSLAQTARNLLVTLDDQVSFAANITVTTCSCRFILHSIRRIRLFLTLETAQVLVQALVILHLDYCNSPGLPPTQIFLESDSRHWYSPTVLQIAQVHPTTRTWSNLTPKPVHYTLLLACYSLSAREAQLPLIKITSVWCPGSTVVERAPCWHQVSRNFTYLQTENSSVQTAPRPIKKKPSLSLI